MKLFPYYLLLIISIWSAGWTVDSTKRMIISDHSDRMNSITNYKNQGPLKIYTEDGVLIGEYGDSRQSITTISRLPEHVVNAILYQEDKEFWTHHGINPKSLARAAKELFEEGRIITGGSTVTMQLVKNHILSREKSFSRKLKEIFLALELEKRYSKEQLLNAYINTIFLGERCYGVGAAARHYFKKEASELTLNEAMRLAVTIRAPSINNPSRQSEKIEKAFYRLGKRMLEAGKISETEFQNLTLPRTSKGGTVNNGIETQSLHYVKDQVYTDLVSIYGSNIESSGWDVVLTVNGSYQAIAEKALQWGLVTYERRSNPFYSIPESAKQVGNLVPVTIKRINSYSLTTESMVSGNQINIFEEGLRWTIQDLMGEETLLKAGQLNEYFDVGDTLYVFKDPYKGWMIGSLPQSNGSITIMDHQTGAVKAMVGGFDYQQSQFNRASQSKRQVASTIKPFLYMLALEQGYKEDSLIDLNLDGIKEDWSFTEKGLDKEIKLREALVASNNQAAVKVLDDIGIPLFRDYLNRFGIDTKEISDTLALALGVAESNTLEMSTAFSTIANGGRPTKSKLIKSIKPRINGGPAPNVSQCDICVNDEYTPIAFSRAVDIKDLLKDVVEHGTAKRAKLLNNDNVGGKTGTSNNAHDLWFTGFSANLTASVWIGGDEAFNQGKTEYGSSVALPIWVEMMEQIEKLNRNSPNYIQKELM